MIDITSPSLTLRTHKMEIIIVSTSLGPENRIGLAQGKCSMDDKHWSLRGTRMGETHFCHPGLGCTGVEIHMDS